MKKWSRNNTGFLALLIITMLVSFGAMIGLFFFYSGEVRKKMLEKDMEQVEWTSHYVTKLIHGEIEHRIRLLKSFEERFNHYNEDQKKEITGELQKIKKDADFKSVSIMALNGNYIDDRGEVGTMECSSFLDIVESGEPYISNVMEMDGKGGGEILLAVPVWGTESVKGALWGSYAVNDIAESIEMSDDFHRYFQIVDDEGRYISYSGNKNSFADHQLLWDELKRYELSEGVTAEGIKKNVESGKSGSFHFTYQGEGRYVTYEPLGINNWMVFSVLVEDFLNDYVEEIERVFTKLLCFLGLFLFLIFSIVFIFICRGMKVIKEQNKKLVVKNSLLQMILERTKDIPFEIDLKRGELTIYYHYLIGEEKRCEVIQDFSPTGLLRKDLIREKDLQKYQVIYEQIMEGREIEPVVLETKLNGVWDYNKIHTLMVNKDYIVGFLEDYNEQQSKGRELEEANRQNRMDALTMLYSRKYLTERIENVLKDTKERCALFVLDLDYFKTVNDTFGHMMGDQVLRETGSRLRSVLRENDLAGRLGGDEFLILMRNIKDLSDVSSYAEKINQALTHTYEKDNQTVTISVSIGIAIAEERKTFSELYERADIMLYQVKREQRNGYQIG